MVDDRDIRFFRENGYWVSDRLFGEGEIEEISSHVHRVLDGRYDKDASPQRDGRIDEGIRKVTNAWWADTVIEEIATDSRLGRIAAGLLGVDEVRLWKDHIIWKPPRSGESGNVGWHQDKLYWQEADTRRMVTVNVAIDDINEANGCLRFIPGSHREGLLPVGDFYGTGIEDQLSDIREVLGGDVDEVPCPVDRGHASFHHCMLLHGSGPNRTGEPRIVLAVHYVEGGAALMEEKDDENYGEEYGIEVGEEFSGPYFPVVWSSSAR